MTEYKCTISSYDVIALSDGRYSFFLATKMTWVLVLLCLLLGLVLPFVRIKPNKHPPGPWFRLPLLGNSYILFGDATKKVSQTRKRYGDVFSVDITSFRQIMVCDLATLREMLSLEVFSGRGRPMANGIEIFARLRGGNGSLGLIISEGEEWKEQRRFAIRHLRDFGFGKSSMEDIIREEFLDIADSLRSVDGLEVETKQLFNLNVVNVLWRMMTGSRFDLKDRVERERLGKMEEVFANFAPTNPSLVMATMLPKFLARMFGGALVRQMQEFFAFFNELYAQHERTFDPSQMRDFIDVYLSERKRVTAENLTHSSFYGEHGRLSYVNTMFDLFLAGSETTSTYLRFLLLYMINYPSVQTRAQGELDRAVGRDRLPSLQDKRDLPYVEALVDEVHRHATIALFGVNHVPMHETSFGGYTLTERDFITPCLYEIHHDPRNFDDPESFRPERFLDPRDGSFVPHPAVIPFGVGKRDCLGKSLAKAEVFLFSSCLLHQFSFHTPSSGSIGVNDVDIILTRAPKPFRVRVESR